MCSPSPLRFRFVFSFRLLIFVLLLFLLAFFPCRSRALITILPMCEEDAAHGTAAFECPQCGSLCATCDQVRHTGKLKGHERVFLRKDVTPAFGCVLFLFCLWLLSCEGFPEWPRIHTLFRPVVCECEQDGCNKTPASVSCVECGLKLSDACNVRMHKTGRAKVHQRNDLAPTAIMCDSNDGQPAFAHCAACGGMNLCVACDAQRHKEHVREAPKIAYEY
jgi:hypothetical protein